MRTIRNLLALTSAVAVFVACGGSGSDTTIATDDPPQQQSTGAATGAARLQSSEATAEGGAPAGMGQGETRATPTTRAQ